MAKTSKRRIIVFSDKDREIFEKLSSGNTSQRRGAIIFQALVLKDDFKKVVEDFRAKFSAKLSEDEVKKGLQGQATRKIRASRHDYSRYGIWHQIYNWR